MAMKKVTSKVIFGSTLLSHYGTDISDTTTSSASFTRWGEAIDFTPVEDNSHIEITLTGSVFSATSMANNAARYGNLSIRVDNTDEYVQYGILGGQTNQASTRHWHNPRHHQHNGRQQFHAHDFGTAVYMTHLYRPLTGNKITIEIMISSDSGHLSLQCKDGFVTISEMSDHHYNKT